jgi:phosphoglycerate dehydrogenase-like enzyme
MLTSLSRALFIAAGLILACPVSAQSNIAELIEQTGIEVGDVAMRDMPGWREPRKIVMPDYDLSAQELEALLPGVEVVIARSEAEILANIKGADAIIGSCNRHLIDAAEDAIWVQVGSAGVDRCVGAERIANGSAVLTNMQKMSSPVIGEHVIALTLSLARNIPQFAKNMSGGKWHRRSDVANGMMSVAGKTMLVIGLGGIGTEAARRAAALDMRVIGTRRSSREGPDFVAYVGLSDELFELAAEADFIVNALPLTKETTGLLNEEFFSAAKHGAFLINVGRGPTVVTDDLVAALKSGKIAGAALDVTDPEPLPADHPLWQMDNVIVTPHVSSRDSNRARRMILLKENLRRFAAGDALLNVVDPELGY